MVMLFAWVLFGVHGSSHPLSMTLSAEEPSTNPTIAPVYWCHVPKTGSSFATTLAHFIAPTLDPEVTIRDPTEEMKQYEGLIMADRVARFKSGHAPVAPEDLKKFSGHLVTLVRRPLERTISGFYHDLHDCKSMQQELGCSETNNKTECGSNVTNFKPYAACVRGCTARMLLGYGCGDPNGVTAETHPTLADDAVQVLRTNFGFVGLSDNWAATICLVPLPAASNPVLATPTRNLHYRLQPCVPALSVTELAVLLTKWRSRLHSCLCRTLHDRNSGTLVSAVIASPQKCSTLGLAATTPTLPLTTSGREIRSMSRSMRRGRHASGKR